MAKRTITSRGLTISQLRRDLSYDPKSGLFRWKGRGRGRKIGKVADHPDGHGYRRVYINRKKYKVHRLAWFYYYGIWPTFDIEHRNGRRDDNRIRNLRPCTQTQNNANAKRRSDNTSGYKRVSRSVQYPGKWRADIGVNGKSIYLGVFSTPLAAHRAYCRAGRKYFGEFFRPN